MSRCQAFSAALCGSANRLSQTALLRRVLIVLFFLLGLGVAVFVACQLNRSKQKEWEDQLVQWCKERSTMLEKDVLTNINQVQVFTTFFEEFKKELVEDSSRFQRFIDRTAYARPTALGIDWSAVVFDKDRSAYEAYWNTSIKDRQTNKSEERRGVYYPITLVSSSLNDMRFLDKQTLSSGDKTWEAALQARFVISAPTMPRPLHNIVMAWRTLNGSLLPQNATSDERVAAVDGVITAVLMFDKLVEKSLTRWATAQPFSFHLYDVTDPSVPAELYIPEQDYELKTSIERTHCKHSEPMDFGDTSRKHEMWCWYKERSVSLSSILWGLSVAVVVFLIACALWGTVRRMEVAWENYQKMEKLKLDAEAADRAKSSFLATMSHELRTPMNGVLGMLNVLKDTNLDAQQAEYARAASSCANALITLVNDILDLAKVESGHMELERTPFDLRIVCNEVLDIFQEDAKKNNVELATLVAPDVPLTVFGDSSRLRQVFINLVGNSLKFMQKGHVFLRISLVKPNMHFPWRESSPFVPILLPTRMSGEVTPVAKFGTLSGCEAADDSNSWEALIQDMVEVLQVPFWHSPLILKGEKRERQSKVLLYCSCEDTGVGISGSVQHRIFSPFMQADSSTARKYGGTGIGLSICQKLVGMMGSEIKLVSRMGVGSTFYFTLEMDAEGRTAGSCEDGCRSRWAECNEQLSGFLQLKGCRVLVAAPRFVRRLVIINALEMLGMELAVAEDLEEARRMLLNEVQEGEDGTSLHSCQDPYTGSTNSTDSRSHLQAVLATQHFNFPSPGARGRASEDVCVCQKAVECVIVDADDWGCDAVLKFAKSVWADSGRVQGREGLPVLLIAGRTFTTGMEERIAQLPYATKIQKPISSSGCGAAIVKALGRAKKKPGIEKPKKFQTRKTFTQGIHVLVVDDNLINRKVASKVLERIGISSQSVESGAEAIAALAEGHPFEAVFMDVQMPEMDGIEATQILRAMGVKSSGPPRDLIPVFAVTADVMKDRQVQCKQAGMDGFIPKPLEPEKLFDVLSPFFPSR